MALRILRSVSRMKSEEKIKVIKATKKPIEVEALKFIYSAEGLYALDKFVGDSLGNIIKARCINAKAEAEILTLEDGKNLKVKHIATEGDWIIKGIKGEF